MNIPAPSQNYDSYYSVSLRQNNVGFANSDSYGSYEGGQTSQSSEVEQYKQALYEYIQNLKTVLPQLQNGDPRRAQAEHYLQQAYEYASQVGLILQANPSTVSEWDPLNGHTGTGHTFTPSYQDTTKVVYDDILPPMTAEKVNLKEEHFYAPPYDFTIPGAATAIATNEVDPNHPDKTRVCVTVTWPDGTVKKHYFYNVEWKENGLILRSTSPEHQITLHESLAGNSHVSTAEMGEKVGGINGETGELSPVNPEASTDSNPSTLSEDGNTATYNREANPIITVYPDGPANNHIDASGTLTLNAYRQSDQFSLSEEGDQLIITVTTTNEKGEEKTLTYSVNKKQIDKVIIGNIDDAQVDLSGIKDPNLLARIMNSAEVAIQDTVIHASAATLEKLKNMGINSEVFLENLQKEFPQIDSNHDGKIDSAEFEAALQGNDFPPTQVNSPDFEKLMTVLLMSNPRIKEIFDKIKEGGLSMRALTDAINSITEEMCKSLSVLYKAKGIEVAPAYFERNGENKAFQISFDGQTAFILPPEFAGLIAMANGGGESDNE